MTAKKVSMNLLGETPMEALQRIATERDKARKNVRRLERKVSLAHRVCNEAIGWVRWTEEHKKCNLRNLVVILSKFWGWKPKKKRGAKK